MKARCLLVCLSLPHLVGSALAQQQQPRNIQVQVIDSTTMRPLLRTVMYEFRSGSDRQSGAIRSTRADTTGGVLRLDSVTSPKVQILCVRPARRFDGYKLADLDSAQLRAAAGGDTLRLLADGGPCDRRELVHEYGTWTGHYVPGFESSDFRVCGDTARSIWVTFVTGFWDKPQAKWPTGGDPYYPRYFVGFHGRLVGPYSYGHLGVSDYELAVDSIVFLRLASPGDCH